MAEFNQNFLDTMAEFSNNKEVSEFLGVFSVISLAIYNCELVAKGIVNPALLINFWASIY